jgi:hypothetical protein
MLCGFADSTLAAVARMEDLEVVLTDIAVLIATCRAARELRAHAMSAHLRAYWHHLVTELKRATLAYAQVFARSEQADDVEGGIAACRAAAEREMPAAIAFQHELRAMMEHDPDARHNSSLVLHDLSRLFSLAFCLRQGGRELGCSATNRHRRHVRKAVDDVQVHLRRAICAYAHASLKGARDSIAKARVAATAHLGRPCIATVCGLARLQVGHGAPRSLIERRVSRPMRHLRKDWKNALRAAP